MNRDLLDAARRAPIDWRYKGFPSDTGATPATVGRHGWSLFAGDLPLPVLVLKEDALAHNLDVMAGWCAARGVSLAPHGKTTMSPELIERQLGSGAWGITAATVGQVRAYRAFGVDRILLANELVDPAGLRWISSELEANPALEFFCYVDSLEALAAMEQVLRSPSRIRVFVELGYPGGRTGARTVESATSVAEAVVASDVVMLAGVAGFEGLLAQDPRLGSYLVALRTCFEALSGQGLFDGLDEVVFTAGGSICFDDVVSSLAAVQTSLSLRVVLRSGCYLIHDSGMYEEQSPFGASSVAERLLAAAEVWSTVLSQPDPGRAVLGMGKRDVGSDASLPVVLHVYDGSDLRVAHGMSIVRLDDQHAYLEFDPAEPVAVGDLIGCGVSHPCTTLDKWRLIPVVDDSYRVIDAVHTFF